MKRGLCIACVLCGFTTKHQHKPVSCPGLPCPVVHAAPDSQRQECEAAVGVVLCKRLPAAKGGSQGSSIGGSRPQPTAEQAAAACQEPASRQMDADVKPDELYSSSD